MLRAVVDANVWVAAALRPSGRAGQVPVALADGRFALVSSEVLLRELAVTLSRPRFARYGYSGEQAEQFVAVLRAAAVALVPVTGEVRVCRDPHDDAVIETAITGRADLLVTGDRDLLDHGPSLALLTAAGVEVIGVTPFLQRLADDG